MEGLEKAPSLCHYSWRVSRYEMNSMMNELIYRITYNVLNVWYKQKSYFEISDLDGISWIFMMPSLDPFNT